MTGAAARTASRPFHVMAKPTGAVCNLDCAYCFYLTKKQLYPGSGFRMPDDVLEQFADRVLADPTAIPLLGVPGAKEPAYAPACVIAVAAMRRSWARRRRVAMAKKPRIGSTPGSRATAGICASHPPVRASFVAGSRVARGTSRAASGRWRR